MEKSILKKFRDNIPAPVNQLLSPFIRHMLVGNSLFKKNYQMLIERESMSDMEINIIQIQKLKEILCHAYTNVPYYKDLFHEISFDPFLFKDVSELEQIPFLTRELINKNFERLISTKKIRKGYYTATTGGSSGHPLKIYMDYNSIYEENAFIYYNRRKLGYSFGDKLVTFRGIDIGPSFWKNNPMHKEIIMSPLKLSKQSLPEYLNRINSFNPVFFNGYLSAIWYFAKLLEESNLEFKPVLKGIFLISENADPKQRQFIENFFKVKSSTFYGHSERCIFGEEIHPNQYKFDPFYGYTETIPNSENRFSIVGTGFLNKTMPLIRYKTDDECELINGYYKIDGKRMSTVGLIGYNNEFVTGSAFDLEDVIFHNIVNYQFIQTEKGKADLRIIVNDKFTPSELESVRNDINHKTKGIIDFKIEIVQDMILSPRGKFQQYLINIKDQPL